MCIRDSERAPRGQVLGRERETPRLAIVVRDLEVLTSWLHICLLYTSDAADERSSVDLGGRRIIKKKTNSKD